MPLLMISVAVTQAVCSSHVRRAVYAVEGNEHKSCTWFKVQRSWWQSVTVLQITYSIIKYLLMTVHYISIFRKVFYAHQGCIYLIKKFMILQKSF